MNTLERMHAILNCWLRHKKIISDLDHNNDELHETVDSLDAMFMAMEEHIANTEKEWKR